MNKVTDVMIMNFVEPEVICGNQGGSVSIEIRLWARQLGFNFQQGK